jgi:uncharacterized protein
MAQAPERVRACLYPPCTTEQAVDLAAAALSDTLVTVATTPAVRHTIVLSGQYRAPAGWCTVAQRGNGRGERLANAFADTALPGVASLLIGMDTPQVTSTMLTGIIALLANADGVLGPAFGGGWWALALRDPCHATVLRQIAMSTPDTTKWTIAALRSRGVRLRAAPTLRDVRSAVDAVTVAGACQPGSFTKAVASYLAPAGTR